MTLKFPDVSYLSEKIEAFDFSDPLAITALNDIEGLAQTEASVQTVDDEGDNEPAMDEAETTLGEKDGSAEAEHNDVVNGSAPVEIEGNPAS